MLATVREKMLGQAAAALNFEDAAKLRDRMKEVKLMLLEIETEDDPPKRASSRRSGKRTGKPTGRPARKPAGDRQEG